MDFRPQAAALMKIPEQEGNGGGFFQDDQFIKRPDNT